MLKNLLIIGAGAVANVVAHKCIESEAQFDSVHMASRTMDSCLRISSNIKTRHPSSRGIASLFAIDAMDTEAVVELIKQVNAHIVINVASPFVNMSVLKACIIAGSAYIDTAIHEDPTRVCEAPPWYENYEWRLASECAQRGITAILGAGFDPGVVNAYVAAASRKLDTVDSVDIVDVNAGSHARYFATNFDPETNFREFTGKVWTWKNRAWVSNEMFEVSQVFNLPEVGVQKLYLCGHDEIHSLFKNINSPNIRFWMGFSPHYINVFTVLKNIGLLSEQPVQLAEGGSTVPLKLVKALLPSPSKLGAEYKGHTFIGAIVSGMRNEKKQTHLLYNVCDHADAFADVGGQAISFTAGVPAAAAALLVARGDWNIGRMANIEELPSEPFLQAIHTLGLETRHNISEGLPEWKSPSMLRPGTSSKTSFLTGGQTFSVP